MSNFSQVPKPAFIVGITGHRDVPKEDEEAIIERLERIFRWMRADRSQLFNPLDFSEIESATAGKSLEPIAGLGLKETPIIVLSSLAPGADSIAAEAVLRSKVPDLRVRAPLPFPKELFTRSSSFYPTDPARSDSTSQDPELAARFDDLCARIEQQQLLVAGDPVFQVRLREDEGLPLETLRNNSEAALTDPKQRNRRYQGAGEYISAYSQLLIALWDSKDNLKAAEGTAAIVQAKRRGLSPELLPLKTSFNWADNGPVLQVPVRRLRNRETPVPGLGPCRFLHPYDLVDDPTRPPVRPRSSWPRRLLIRLRILKKPTPPPPGPIADDDPGWQERGARLFLAIARRMEHFNRLSADFRAKNGLEPESGALANLLVSGDEPEGEAPSLDHLNLSPEAREFVDSLEPLARTRRLASELAKGLDRKRRHTMILLLICVILSAVSLHGFNYWDLFGFQRNGDALGFTLMQILFLATAMSFPLIGIWLYKRHESGQTETNRHDFRAVAEGLRVQIFWRLIGLGRSVPANYMQRQTNELDWIRNTISSLTFPYQDWMDRFDQLGKPDQRQLTRLTARRWAIGQFQYYQKRRSENLDKLHASDTIGWGFGFVALIHVFVMLLCQWAPISTWLGQNWWLFAAGGALAYLIARAAPPKRPESPWMSESMSPADEQIEDREPPAILWLRWFFRVFGRHRFWPFPCFVLGATLWLPFVMPELTKTLGPNDDLRVLVLGLILLSGGIVGAWAGKRLYAEHFRQYASMRCLFEAGERRLRFMTDPPPGSEADDAYDLHHIRELVFALGCESLDENAEWLMLHRARPLEPFMAA